MYLNVHEYISRTRICILFKDIQGLSVPWLNVSYQTSGEWTLMAAPGATVRWQSCWAISSMRLDNCSKQAAESSYKSWPMVDLTRGCAWFTEIVSITSITTQTANANWDSTCFSNYVIIFFPSHYQANDWLDYELVEEKLRTTFWIAVRHPASPLWHKKGFNN